MDFIKDQKVDEIKDRTLLQLRKSRAAMLKLDYLLELEKLSIAEQKEAAWQLAQVQLAYLQLRRASLQQIGERLQDNRVALADGIVLLQERLADLRKVRIVTGAVKDFLQIVGRIIGTGIG